MIYRKLTPEGDYSFGQSRANFLSDLEAVAQAVKTRLQLWKETFWRDLQDGLPLFQEILGTPGSQSNIQRIDAIIQGRILGTQGVLGLPRYSSAFDPETRAYQFTATVQTIYSTTIISGSF